MGEEGSIHVFTSVLVKKLLGVLFLGSLQANLIGEREAGKERGRACFYRNLDFCSRDKVSFCMETGMTFGEGVGKLGLKGMSGWAGDVREHSLRKGQKGLDC